MKVRVDFMVVPKAKMFSVHGRRSFWDGSEWHWDDGWHVNSYRTAEKAEREAERSNKMYGFTTEIGS